MNRAVCFLDEKMSPAVDVAWKSKWYVLFSVQETNGKLNCSIKIITRSNFTDETDKKETSWIEVKFDQTLWG